MIQSQHAGGMLLPPVQKLVATIVFAICENANKSLLRFSFVHHPIGWRFYLANKEKGGFEKSKYNADERCPLRLDAAEP